MATLVFLLLAGCGGPKYKAVEVAPEQPASKVAEAKPSFPDPQSPSPDGAPRTVPLEGYKRIEWKVLRGLDVKTGKSNADVMALNGANIKISGFMVPFDDDEDNVTEFLLVPQAGMCIHTPPPPPNQIILVEVGTGGAHRVEWDKEVQVYGQFQIADGSSPYGKTGFRVSAIRARAE